MVPGSGDEESIGIVAALLPVWKEVIDCDFEARERANDNEMGDSRAKRLMIILTHRLHNVLMVLCRCALIIRRPELPSGLSKEGMWKVSR